MQPRRQVLKEVLAGAVPDEAGELVASVQKGVGLANAGLAMVCMFRVWGLGPGKKKGLHDYSKTWVAGNEKRKRKWKLL